MENYYTMMIQLTFIVLVAKIGIDYAVHKFKLSRGVTLAIIIVIILLILLLFDYLYR